MYVAVFLGTLPDGVYPDDETQSIIVNLGLLITYKILDILCSFSTSWCISIGKI